MWLGSSRKHEKVGKENKQEIRKNNREKPDERKVLRAVSVLFPKKGHFNCLHLNLKFSADKIRCVHTTPKS